MSYNVWLFAVAGFETYLSTMTKRYSEDKTLYLHVTQPLQIAAVVVRFVIPNSYVSHFDESFKSFIHGLYSRISLIRSRWSEVKPKYTS